MILRNGGSIIEHITVPQCNGIQCKRKNGQHCIDLKIKIVKLVTQICRITGLTIFLGGLLFLSQNDFDLRVNQNAALK